MAVHSEITRASEEKSENEAHGVIIHKLNGAEDLVKLPPTFSNDAKYVFVVSGANIRVYSTQSGSQTLLLQGHQGNVIGVQVSAAGNELLSMDSSGKLVTWDYVTGDRKNDFDWGQIVQGVFNSFHVFMGQLYVSLHQGEDKTIGALYHLQASKKVRKLFRHGVSMNGVTFGCAGGNTGVVAVLGKDHVLVKDIKSGLEKKHMTDVRTFTCVALHATELIMATGDISGRVIVWYDFLKHNRPPKTVYHWHTLPVSALAFSVEGSFLFSGGAENTLVKWSLRSNVKSFLPRMGSPIAHIVNAPDNVYVATSHVDNAIRLIDKTNKIQRSILGLVKHNGKQVLPAGLVYDPRSRGVYLNGLIGHLQLFDVANETLIFNLDITNRNVITDERSRSAGNIDVMKVAVSHTGRWLATVEAWSLADSQLLSEVQLKFWKYDQTVQNFSLNTSVTTPHQGQVTSIAFQPAQDEPCFVSIGTDKKFKIWRLTEEDDVYSKQSVSTWFCDSVGEFRRLEPRCVAFSEDGSLLTVGFGNLVTVWDPFAVQLKTTLSHALIASELAVL